MASSPNVAFERGLPANVDAERFVLGSIVLDDQNFVMVAGTLETDDFSVDKHRRIFGCMAEMNERGERIDRVTIANELMRRGQLEAVDGFSYLVSLDEGLPALYNLESYVRIVKDKAMLRRLIFASQSLIDRCLLAEEEPGEILASAEDMLLKLGETRAKATLLNPQQVIDQVEGGIEVFLNPSKRLKGLSSGFIKLDEMTSGFHPGELIILAARPAMGKCLAWNTPIVDAATGERMTVQEAYRRGQAEQTVHLHALDNAGQLRAVTPSAYIDDGVKPVFRVRTRLGRKVTVTASHPFLTGEGWKPLAQLAPGVRIAAPRRVPVFGRGRLAREQVILLAYLLGDGTLSKSTPELTTNSPEILAEVQDCAERLGLQVTHSPQENRCPGYRIGTPRGQANPLINWLREWGVWGKTAHHKSVPDVVYTLERDLVALFLNRLFATDGTAWLSEGQNTYGRVAYCSVSAELVAGVQHLLLRFGIQARVRQRQVKYGEQRRLAYELEVMAAPDILAFADEIGIFSKESALARLREFAASRTVGYTRDTLPISVWQDVLAAKGTRSWGDVNRTLGEDAGKNWHVMRRSPRRETILRLAKALACARLQQWAQSDIYWDEIVSIEPDGEQQVYDFTIPEWHNFVAADLCLHNTAFALNIAHHAATHPGLRKTVAVFSLEMSADSLLTRMICAAARVDQHRFRAGYLNEEERRRLAAATSQLAEAPLYIDDTAGANLMDVHAKLRRLRAEAGSLDLVIIDYLQLMSGRGKVENRQQEVSTISRGLKLMSKELRVPFLVLSQLSRAPETRPGDHRPQLSDLRESGSIEQDADLVGFIFREEVYKPDREDLKGLAKFIIGKQRNGPIGDVNLVFLREFTKFENPMKDLGEDE